MKALIAVIVIVGVCFMGAALAVGLLAELDCRKYFGVSGVISAEEKVFISPMVNNVLERLHSEAKLAEDSYQQFMGNNYDLETDNVKNKLQKLNGLAFYKIQTSERLSGACKAADIFDLLTDKELSRWCE
ncbi:MAG: hypothetical protein WD898_03405 [Candidatus Paceibacterota bacterium]